VVVSCGAVNSAALLLRSAGDQHPDGLANASGVVGRHYMAHINSGVIALSRQPNPTRFQKTRTRSDKNLSHPNEGVVPAPRQQIEFPVAVALARIS
jgi:choline dehydrogenase-like flavoprotein